MPVSFVIPCEAQWVEGIYRLETTDRVLGYNPDTGEDGPANTQWRELGDRTLYLKALLDTEHEEGHHSLVSANFTDDAKIPESALHLDHGTEELKQLIDEVRNRNDAVSYIINNLTDVNVSYMSVLTVLLPYSREYFKTGTDYELFTDAVKMRNFGYTRIVREIAGDDSLDVGSTKDIVPGKTYFLMDNDGGRVEEVIVLSVLTESRIRLTTDLQYTRTSGYLGASTLLPENGKASTSTGFTYTAGPLDTLATAAYGKFYIHRDDVAIQNRRVLYQKDGSSTWQTAEFLGEDHFYDGTIDDVYRLPSGILKLRVEYGTPAERYSLYYMVLKAVNNYVATEDVRRPVIDSVEVNNNTFTVHGNGYASLWGIPQKSASVRIINENEYLPDYSVITAYGDVQTLTVTMAGTLASQRPLCVQLRYTDEEGTSSRWSNGYTVY